MYFNSSSILATSGATAASIVGTTPQYLASISSRCFTTGDDHDNQNSDGKKGTENNDVAASWNLDDLQNDKYDKYDDDDDAQMFRTNDYEITEDDEDEDEDGAVERERYRLQQIAINAELDTRTGRPWSDPWEITDDQWMNPNSTSETLPDWSPEHVSRISLERIQLFDGGIPTLKELSELEMMTPASQSGVVLHPSRNAKKYANYRKSSYYTAVVDVVHELAKDRVDHLLHEAATVAAAAKTTAEVKTEEWYNRRDQVDSLFETIQDEAKKHEHMDILSKHPHFSEWVDRALEDYLRQVQKDERLLITTNKEVEDASNDTDPASTTAMANEGKHIIDGKETGEEGEDDGTKAAGAAVIDEDEKVVRPIFMDCYDPTVDGIDGGGSGGGGNEDRIYAPNTKKNVMVPEILSPLSVHKNGNPGRMVEDWELAAHATTKRIMIRDCTKQIAKHLLEDDDNGGGDAGGGKRIYVHGKRGVGKTSVLASIVASCRTSNSNDDDDDDDENQNKNKQNIVMYMPDGDRLSKNGYYILPNSRRDGIYDLEDLSQEVIQQLLSVHEEDINALAIKITATMLEEFFTEKQLNKVYEHFTAENKNDNKNKQDISLIELMKYSQSTKMHAPMIYSIMVDLLMKLPKDSDTNFFIVMDEFNCLYNNDNSSGYYYHMAYDNDVRKSIPYNQINLFEPIMKYMNFNPIPMDEDFDIDDTGKDDDKNITASVIVGTTESHAIRRVVTDSLTSCAERMMFCIEVPRFTSLEVDHILANYEATGIGRLRSDQGTILMNQQEVEFLKMCSGSVGQNLLDASVLWG